MITESRTALATYLRNHEAVARGGVALFARVARGQRDRPYGAELSGLRDDVRVDLASLRTIMRRLDVDRARLLGAAVETGEALGRLKPNGRLVRRAPVTDLLEVEAMLDAVRAKTAGWQALAAAGVGPSEELVTLQDRAAEQADRLQAVHLVAARVLAAPGKFA